MKNPALLLLTSFISLSACNTPEGNATIVVDTIAIASKADNALVASKAAELTYVGTLPCADCSGILTEITFHTDSMIYTISETYKGTPDGDRTYESFGTYLSTKGTASDPEALIFHLNPENPNQTKFFKQLGESGIKMLDKNQNEITSALNYVLVRK